MLAYVRTCAAYALRSRALAVLLTLFMLLMAAPAVVPAGSDMMDLAAASTPYESFAASELVNVESMTAAIDAGAAGVSAQEAAAWQQLAALCQDVSDASTEAARYAALAAYYDAKVGHLERGTLENTALLSTDALTDARLLATRYRRLADYAGSRAVGNATRDDALVQPLTCRQTALAYLANQVAFQPSFPGEALGGGPLALLAPQAFLYSDACLLWCLPIAVIAARLARLGWRDRLLTQAPLGPGAALLACTVASVGLSVAFVLAALVPAALVCTLRSGAGSPLVPVTLLRDGAIIETTVGGVLALQLALLALTALAIAALVELARALGAHPALAGSVAALVCAVPLAPVYDTQARAGVAALRLLPQTYLNLRRVAGTALADGDLARETLYLSTSGLVEHVIEGVTPARAALVLVGCSLTLLALARLALAVKRPSLRRAAVSGTTSAGSRAARQRVSSIPHPGGDAHAQRH